MKKYMRMILAAVLTLTWGAAGAAVTFDSTKQYSIKNVDCGLYMSLQKDYSESSSVNATPLTGEPSYFTLTANDKGVFAIQQGSLYMAISTSIGWNTSTKTTANYIWTIEEAPTAGQYYIKSSKGYLKYDGKNKYAYTNGGTSDKVTWMIEERIPYASELEEDAYYRIKNFSYGDRLLSENYTSNGTISGMKTADVKSPYCQIWQLKKTGTESGTQGKWTLTNLLSGHVIKSQGTTSAQFSAGAAPACSFVVQDGQADGQTYFTFGLSKGGAGLHCASSQGYNVVNWSVTAEASRWYLQKVEVTEDMLTEAANIFNEYNEAKKAVTDINNKRTTYNNILTAVFEDLSCSELKEEYASKTDEELLAALAEAPESVKEMALRVKSGVWESGKSAEYNDYVKKFRIGTYEPYSDRQTWKSITGVGPFGELVNPTGVTVKAGEIVYIYLDNSAKDSYASIFLELAKGTEHTGTTVTLKKGINAWQAPDDGELFVGYFIKNDKKYVVATPTHEADYPNIRVHIEGGHATGTWDMHRGMTNDDWTWLCKNMFGAPYLHVKGESTVLSLVTEKVAGAPNVEGIMKIWDFIFEGQERLLGNDGQWDGRYRPVITPRDCNVSMNPNWGGNCGTNHPSISKDYLFNFEKMVNDVGHLWEIYHEEAHAHQYPINLAATTESSNNGYAQMVNYEFGSYNSRNKGIETLIIFKNNGWGWVDILRGGEGTSRSNGFEYYDAALWAQCHMFYQLYLYFHVQGYMPDFWPRVADKMRSNGGISYGRSVDSPGYYYNDYLKFADVCAEVSQTDLYEFFDSWGFFGYYDEVKVGNTYDGFKTKDSDAKGVRFVGDYGAYYLKMPVRGNSADEKRLSNLRDKMHAYAKKAPGIMFIDDHIKEMKVTDTCFIASIYPKRVGTAMGFYGVTKGTSGDVGMFWEFNGKNEATELYYTISGSSVTIHGSGFVGIKIYDADGNLIRIYNKKKFTVDSDTAKGLKDGSLKMMAPLGNDTQVEVGLNKPVDGIGTVLAGDAYSEGWFDLNGRTLNGAARNGIGIKNGKKVLLHTSK